MSSTSQLGLVFITLLLSGNLFASGSTCSHTTRFRVIDENLRKTESVNDGLNFASGLEVDWEKNDQFFLSRVEADPEIVTVTISTTSKMEGYSCPDFWLSHQAAFAYLPGSETDVNQFETALFFERVGYAQFHLWHTAKYRFLKVLGRDRQVFIAAKCISANGSDRYIYKSHKIEVPAMRGEMLVNSQSQREKARKEDREFWKNYYKNAEY